MDYARGVTLAACSELASTMNQTDRCNLVDIGAVEVVPASGAFHVVDLFLSLGGILLLGVVAKVAMGLVVGWQTDRERAVTEHQRVE
jgi:hypothetical protein